MPEELEASSIIPDLSCRPNLTMQIHTSDRDIRKIICTLRLYAQWTYPQLHKTFGIPLGSLHRIVHHSEIAPPLQSSHTSERGRKPVVNSGICKRLIETATASSHNRRLPYTQVSELAGIQLGKATLKKIFENAGYHRRVARKKPFLSLKAKENTLAWGERFQDWLDDDWGDVI